jgi:hypothetical protein
MPILAWILKYLIEGVLKGDRHHYIYKVHDNFSAMLIGAESELLERKSTNKV